MNVIELAEKQEQKKSAKAVGVPENRDVASVWIRLFEEQWSSLAMVPVDAQANRNALIGSFEGMGRAVDGSATRVIDVRGQGLEQMPGIRAELDAARERDERVLVLVDPPAQSALSLAVVRSTDAAVLLVALGKTALEETRKTAELCAPERMIGCVTVR